MRRGLSDVRVTALRGKVSGFMLIEVMVSVMLIAMTFMALLYSQLQSNRLAANSRYINISKVVLRNLVDRFQTTSRTDPILSTTSGFVSDTDLGITDENPAVIGFQAEVYDPNPSNPGDDAIRLLALVERQVSLASGSVDSSGMVTSNSALIHATFRLTYRPQGGKQDVVITMSTSRAIP